VSLSADVDEYIRDETEARFSDIYKHLLISFHKPNFFDTETPKKPSVGHCVHMVHGLVDNNSTRFNRMRNWLNIQRHIGIDKVKLYMTSAVDHNASVLVLKEAFGDFIELVDYRLEFEFICKHAISLHNRDAFKMNDHEFAEVVDHIYRNCERLFNVFFNVTINSIVLKKYIFIYFFLL
jgi:hypothetical protein